MEPESAERLKAEITDRFDGEETAMDEHGASRRAFTIPPLDSRRARTSRTHSGGSGLDAGERLPEGTTTA